MSIPNDTPQVSDDASASRNANSGASLSMHDGVEVWCDCCSCEAEPYWVAAMQQEDAPNDQR